MDRSVSGQASSSHSDTSSNAETDDSRGEENNLNCLESINDADGGSDQNGREADSQSSVDELTNSRHCNNRSTSLEERTARVESWQGQLSENFQSELQRSESDEFSRRRNDAEADLNSHQREDATECSSSSVRGEKIKQGCRLQETIEISYAQSLQSPITMGQMNGSINFQEHLAESINLTVTIEEQPEEENRENEESDWQLINGESSDWRHDTQEEADTDIPESFSTRMSQISSVDEDREAHGVLELPEMEPDDVDLQRSQQDWAEERSDEDTVSSGRPATVFRAADDNENMELRELSSR